jgi:hypothetical protein
MAEKTIYLTNLKEVQADFKNQDRHFHKEIAKSMRVIGNQIKASQKTILSQRVVNWTGALAKSIRSKPKRKSVEIGGTIVYADFIEAGGRGGFMGYWYMKTSLSMNKAFIMNKLKKDMGSTAKLKY